MKHTSTDVQLVKYFKYQQKPKTKTSIAVMEEQNSLERISSLEIMGCD